MRLAFTSKINITLPLDILNEEGLRLRNENGPESDQILTKEILEYLIKSKPSPVIETKHTQIELAYQNSITLQRFIKVCIELRKKHPELLEWIAIFQSALVEPEALGVEFPKINLKKSAASTQRNTENLLSVRGLRPASTRARTRTSYTERELANSIRLATPSWSLMYEASIRSALIDMSDTTTATTPDSNTWM